MNSKSHISELFRQTVIYGLGIMLNKSVGFLLIPLYTKYFPPEQIGLFTLVQSLSLFLGVVYMFGMETSFMKFFIDEKGEKDKAEVYSSTLIFLFIVAAALSSFIYIYSGSIAELFKFSPVDESSFLVQILSLMMLIDTLYRFPLLLFRAKLESKTYALINLFTFFINIISNVVFIVILKYGVESIFYSYILSSGITLLAGLILTRNYLTVRISLSKIREMLGFGSKFIFIGFFVLFIDVSDRFFLKYYFDEFTVGVYSANYRLASVMSFLIASFKFSWTPYFLNLKTNPENKKIISSIFTNFILAGLTLFLIFSLFTELLVKIPFFGIEFLNFNYWDGLKIIPVILLAYFFSGAYSTLNAAPFFTDNTGAIFFITLSGVIVNVLFNFLLIPLLNITGASLATLFTYMVMFVIVYYYSQKIYRVKHDIQRILKIGLITAVFFIVGYYFINDLEILTGYKILINLFVIGAFIFTLKVLNLLDLSKLKLLWKK